MRTAAVVAFLAPAPQICWTGDITFKNDNKLYILYVSDSYVRHYNSKLLLVFNVVEL